MYDFYVSLDRCQPRSGRNEITGSDKGTLTVIGDRLKCYIGFENKEPARLSGDRGFQGADGL